ncbi:MAG: hypothetical protein K6B67_05885 [Lachnospiraceae bacterium]|nr:hypothetical protein [Lachnospiraceae bacterium]
MYEAGNEQDRLEKLNEQENARFSVAVVEGESGKKYENSIVLDTPLFNNVPKRKWNRVLHDFVYNNLAGKEIIVYDENGNEEIISIAKTNDRVKKDGAKNSHKVIDKIANYRGFKPKARMIAQIEDIAYNSFYTEENNEHTHQWMDENRWEFRDAYILDTDGTLYVARLNIGKGNNRNIIYEIWPIKEVDRGKVALLPKGNAPSLNVDSNNKIPSLNENGNSQNLTSHSIAVDSEGHELSQGQQDYFKDSKIIDEKGRLKVMYHGTSEYGFTVFDKKKAKSSGYYGKGFYFSDADSHAGQYGKQYKVFLNITNPFEAGDHNITKEQF